MTTRGALAWSGWLELDTASAVLDVGCNVGHLLQTLEALKPGIRLAGIEVNQLALDSARLTLPHAELHLTGAEKLPFGASEFDRVTCVEVLEHIPVELRHQAIQEIHRVLKTNGMLLLQVPHAGRFDWLDPGNFRFRLPKLYSAVLGRGNRDIGMSGREEGVVWHHHFTLKELESLTSGLFRIERVHRGGSFVMPLSDLARWPFYRMRVYTGRVFRFLGEASDWDHQRDYGDRAYDVRLLLRKL